MSPAEHEANMRILEGSFRVEGIVLTEENKSNLYRFACGETTSQELIVEIMQKYKSAGTRIIE